jgi:hypothetical protein
MAGQNHVPKEDVGKKVDQYIRWDKAIKVTATREAEGTWQIDAVIPGDSAKN